MVLLMLHCRRNMQAKLIDKNSHATQNFSVKSEASEALKILCAIARHHFIIRFKTILLRTIKIKRHQRLLQEDHAMIRTGKPF